MLNLTLSFDIDGKVPLYWQLYEFIRTEIAEGNLLAGERLPSTRGLANHLGVSRNTIESAYDQLIAEGYIKPIPRSGHIVCKIEGLYIRKGSLGSKKRFVLEETVDLEEDKGYLYDFKTNAVDLDNFPFALWSKISREIMHDENKNILKLTHAQGDYLLRKALAKYLHEFRGVNCTPEQIIIGAGTEYIIGLLLQIIGDGATYAIENPGYMKVNNILNSYNKNINLIGLDEEGLSVKELEKSNSNIVYVTPSHQFPLGIIMPISRRLQLLDWASLSDDRYIIEDDYDSEFKFTGRPIPALQGLKGHEKVIYISTFSKTLAPSIRISYMVLPQLLLEKYNKNFMFYSSTVPRFEQYILHNFMENGYFERHLNKMRNIYKNKKDILVETIRRSPHGKKIKIMGEDAGLHLLLEVNNVMDEAELIESAKKKSGIKVYGLSETYIRKVSSMPRSVVILGYAHLTNVEIEEAINLLLRAWF